MRLRKPIILALLAGMITTLLSCGLDVEDGTAPERPEWVTKSLPAEWPERGIDAHENRAIYLEWINSSNIDMAYYQIYRSEYFPQNGNELSYRRISRILAEPGSEMSYLDTLAMIDRNYAYYLIAEDYAGNLSETSDTLRYSLLLPIYDSVKPISSTDTIASTRELRWRYIYTVAMETYTVTVLDINFNYRFRSTFLPTDYTGRYEFFQIPDSVNLESGNIYLWRVDVGANYVNGTETSGGESSWFKFYYNG